MITAKFSTLITSLLQQFILYKSTLLTYHPKMLPMMVQASFKQRKNYVISTVNMFTQHCIEHSDVSKYFSLGKNMNLTFIAFLLQKKIAYLYKPYI